MISENIIKEKNEKIHNRSKPRVASSAGDHCARFKDHEQWLGEAWSTDRDQRPAGTSAKPPDTRIKPQATSRKQQAASHKQHNMNTFQ